MSQVGAEHLQRVYTEMDLASVWSSDVRCPDAAAALRMTQLIEDARSTGDTVGGCVTCVVKGTPTGLGEPVFDKLHADLGKAMLSVNAVKGFQIGSGFAAAGMRGSEHNDAYVARTARVGTLTNRSGGVQGGISNGEDIIFDVAFKPVSTLMRDQSSIDRAGGRLHQPRAGCADHALQGHHVVRHVEVPHLFPHLHARARPGFPDPGTRLHRHRARLQVPRHQASLAISQQPGPAERTHQS